MDMADSGGHRLRVIVTKINLSELAPRGIHA
jgi:hypothetical protein